MINTFVIIIIIHFGLYVTLHAHIYSRRLEQFLECMALFSHGHFPEKVVQNKLHKTESNMSCISSWFNSVVHVYLQRHKCLWMDILLWSSSTKSLKRIDVRVQLSSFSLWSTSKLSRQLDCVQYIYIYIWFSILAQSEKEFKVMITQFKVETSQVKYDNPNHTFKVSGFIF